MCRCIDWFPGMWLPVVVCFSISITQKATNLTRSKEEEAEVGASMQMYYSTMNVERSYLFTFHRAFLISLVQFVWFNRSFVALRVWKVNYLISNPWMYRRIAVIVDVVVVNRISHMTIYFIPYLAAVLANQQKLTLHQNSFRTQNLSVCLFISPLSGIIERLFLSSFFSFVSIICARSLCQCYCGRRSVFWLRVSLNDEHCNHLPIFCVCVFIRFVCCCCDG